MKSLTAIVLRSGSRGTIQARRKTTAASPPFNQPLGGNEMPRFHGPATMFRLPPSTSAEGLHIAIVGVGLDIGTSNRTGTRFGPRQIRAESCMVRPYGMATKGAPFDSFQVGDIGDVPLNAYNLPKSVAIIEDFYATHVVPHAKPVSLGGDHTISLPILRALYQKRGVPLALVHIDAHADVSDHMFGERVAHGTIFRRAIEEGLVDPHKMVQLGIRGTGYTAHDFDWTVQQGATIFPAEQCWYRSMEPIMEQVREIIGPDTPTYLTFDIDGLDPSVAPGTGTPEPGGLLASQGVEIIRGCFGLNLVGADIVEVSPPSDLSGNTSLLAANLVFEMLCSFPGCIRR
ncbi:Guanidinobutyrase [Diplonema papillatum]|nr:Guanidinobutyrase [Diplonema papillatum]